MFKKLTACKKLTRVLADGTGCLGVCNWINIRRCGKLCYESIFHHQLFVVQQNYPKLQ